VPNFSPEKWRQGQEQTALRYGDGLEPRFRDYQDTVSNQTIDVSRGMTIPLDPAMSVVCISSVGVVLTDDEKRATLVSEQKFDLRATFVGDHKSLF
jgi:hypothetical protein